MNRLTLFILTALLTGAAACSDKHERFGSFSRLSEKGWAYGDTVRITASRLASTQEGRELRLGVRHRTDYPYRNLALEVTYTADGKVRRDTVIMELADRYGSWKGNGMGPLRQFEAPVFRKVSMPDSSDITIRHVMKTDTLRGISEIGVLIDNR